MVNKKYKDRLFCLLFGNEEHKDNILSLYNALCHTTYTNEEDIQIYTIDDVIYIKMKNDVSILLDSFLYLWEQQSTFNPNMPIRGFMYFGKMYDRYITENSLNIYGKTIIKLPTPRYTVLYNGMDEQPSFMQLRLSDSFINPDYSGAFEWTASMVNLNDGKNEDLLNNCRPLKDYMTLINEIRKNSKIMNFENAVDAAVTYCIEHDVLKTFLLKHRAEVKDVCITEYDEKTFVDGIRAEGRAEGRLSEIFDSVQAEDYGVERGAQKAGMSLPEFEKAMEAAGYKIPECV
ncbi:MAG: hypothetical protein SOT58_09015 [Agathobacter sp.]|nr:hypothetical protein [Agathobacter sp.]